MGRGWSENTRQVDSVVVVVVSHASLPYEGYWKLVLPRTPMPKAVKDHLQPGLFQYISRLSGHILSFRLFDLTLKYFIPNTPFGTAIF